MKRILRSIIVCIMFLFIINTFNFYENCSAASTIIYVNPGESIQNAIDNANESDIIHLNSGTYYENIVINKPLTIYGDNSDNTKLYPEDPDDLNVILISSADNVELSKLTITQNQSENPQNTGIFIQCSDQCTISQCTISEFYSGIWIKSSNYNIIDDNIVEECHGSGIIIDGSNSLNSNNNNIISNIIRNNEDKGIYIEDKHSKFNNIYYNDFFYNFKNADNTFDSDEANNWDDGSEGNKWSDYTGTDSNGDGIGDIVYNKNGVIDNYPTGYFVNQKPTAYIVSINPSSPEEGETVYFTGSGSDDGWITTYEWKIDGSTTKYGENTHISGLSVGSHTVKLRVKDNDDEWSDWTSTESFTVHSADNGEEEQNQKPIATIAMPDSPYTTEDYGNNITFLGGGSDPDEDGLITAYEWESNIDGVISNKKYFFTNSLSVGTHKVYFRVKDNENEWSDPDQVTVQVNQITSGDNIAPNAATNGPYNAYTNESISFDASDSFDTDGIINSYQWSFGDGNTASGKTVTHTYTKEENYSVTLTVTDNKGSIDAETTTANILKNPEDPQNNDNNDTEDTDDKWVIPGFEMILCLFGIITVIILNKRKK